MCLKYQKVKEIKAEKCPLDCFTITYDIMGSLLLIHWLKNIFVLQFAEVELILTYFV